MSEATEQLREFRERADLTQEELAHLLGMSWVTISRWERGEAEPKRASSERLERLRKLVARIGSALPPGELSTFLETLHPALRHHRPVDLLDSEYAFEDLIALVERAKSGDMA